MENLVGTEKQINWANKIREEKLRGLRTSLTETDVTESLEFLRGERETFSRTGRFCGAEDVVSILMVEKDTQKIEAFLQQQTDAAWWIENRNTGKNDFLFQSDDEISTNRTLRRELRKADKDAILQWFLG